MSDERSVLGVMKGSVRPVVRRIRRLYQDPAKHEPRHLRSGHARIRARQPDLRLFQGRLCVPHETVLPETAAERNAQMVIDALEAAGVPFTVLRPLSPLRRRVGVPIAQRAQAFAALRERFADDAVYVHPVLTVRGELGNDALVADALEDAEIALAETIRVTRNYVAGTTWPLRYGPRFGCDVSFYGVADGLAFVPRPSDPPERVPEPELWARAVTIGDREVPAAEAVGTPRAGAVDYPVDVVYLWVDGGDPQWQRRKAAALQGVPVEELTPDGVDASRFRDHDELRYSLRSLEMYAPWVRHIYLVTDDQRPAWLVDDHPRLTVVDHRDIFSDPSVLPTFNSHAISCQVHHIEGLSEQYLLLNDDVFFGRPVRPDLFFHANGLSKFFLSRHFLDHGHPDAGDAPQYTARRNSRRLIFELFGVEIRTTTKHTPIPQRRSVMAELEERFPDVFARTAGSRFRDPGDYQIENVLHMWYAYGTGRAVPGEISYSYVALAGEELALELERLLRRRRRDVFCINDTPDNPSPEERESAVSQFLADYFPVRSSFERPGA